MIEVGADVMAAEMVAAVVLAAVIAVERVVAVNAAVAEWVVNVLPVAVNALKDIALDVMKVRLQSLGLKERLQR